jgi:hypothetical protein
MEMNKYYFTFGWGHYHIYNGEILDKDIVLEVTALTYNEARNKIFRLFGSRWCMQYEDLPEMEHFPGGIVKLDG